MADGSRWPTTAPRRSTVIVSAIAWTSLSLCEMKMIGRAAVPQLADDAEQLLGLGRGEHRRRLVQDQHVRLPDQRLDDLDPLLDADRQVLDQRVRVDVEPVAVGELATSRRVLRRSSRPAGPACSMPSVTFSATVKTGTSMKCWCTMPMPAAIASFGERKLAALPSMMISPSSG